MSVIFTAPLMASRLLFYVFNEGLCSLDLTDRWITLISCEARKFDPRQITIQQGDEVFIPISSAFATHLHALDVMWRVSGWKDMLYVLTMCVHWALFTRYYWDDLLRVRSLIGNFNLLCKAQENDFKSPVKSAPIIYTIRLNYITKAESSYKKIMIQCQGRL